MQILLQGEKTVFTNSCFRAVSGILAGGGPGQGRAGDTTAPDHTAGPWLFSWIKDSWVDKTTPPPRPPPTHSEIFSS